MIKTLMGSIRDYMKVTVATPLLVLGEVLCEMLIPFITANLIDAIKDGTTVAEMLPTAGFLVLIALTSLAFGAAAGVTCSHASCGFAKNLRHDLFYKIQTFSFANIDEFSSSSLVTRLTTDINNVQQAFMMIIRIAVRAPLVLIFAFTMAFIMGGSVAMVYLVIIPLLGFGLFFIIFKVRPIFSRVFHKYDALNESVEENVTGMRVVKSYVREAGGRRAPHVLDRGRSSLLCKFGLHHQPCLHAHRVRWHWRIRVYPAVLFSGRPRLWFRHFRIALFGAADGECLYRSAIGYGFGPCWMRGPHGGRPGRVRVRSLCGEHA